MRTIVIGDIHGLTRWKIVLELQKQYDKVIFLGDYFDSFYPYTADEQICNFNEILDLKIAAPEKFILLIGNHDFHYMKGVNEKYSGYNELYADEIQETIHAALSKNLLQIAHLQDNHLFTHAGVTNTWLKNNNYDFLSPVDEFMNQLFLENPLSYKFTRGINNSNSGDDICQSPIWVREKSLFEDKFSNYIQFVGHTQKPFVTLKNGVYFCDALDRFGSYCVIENSDVILYDLLNYES